MNDLWLLFQYGFILRALVVGGAIALSSSAIGTFLVMKKFSLIGDGLAHVSFGAIALGLVLDTTPLYLTIPIVSFVAIIIMRINEKAKITSDSAIGILSTFAIAFGTILINVFGVGGGNIDNYLFGNILLITKQEVGITLIVTFIVLLMVIVFYQDFFAITFDEEFATASHMATKKKKYLLGILTALVIVTAIKAVGTLLISSMIIFPTLIALQFTRGFKSTILLSSFISLISIFFGLLISFVISIPTGSTIVVFYGLIYAIIVTIRQIWKRNKGGIHHEDVS